MIDCNAMPLPFGPQFVADIVNRTHLAQNLDEALLAAELVLTAQEERKMGDARGLTIRARMETRRAWLRLPFGDALAYPPVASF